MNLVDKGVHVCKIHRASPSDPLGELIAAPITLNTICNLTQHYL